MWAQAHISLSGLFCNASRAIQLHFDGYSPRTAGFVFSHNSLSSGHITGGGGLWPLVESAPQEKISSFAKEGTRIGAGLSPHFPGKHHEQACRSGYLPVGGLFYSCPGFCLWLISEFFRRSDHKA
jgi:hypothetical protein